jgi:cytochrome P450
MKAAAARASVGARVAEGRIAMSVSFDPMSMDHWHDPFPVYRALRDAGPVHHAPASDVHSVARYDDVVSVLKRPDVFSSRAMLTVLMNGGRGEGLPPLSPAVVAFLARFVWHTRMNPFRLPKARNLIAEDPPTHGVLRGLVNRGFTPRRIAAWETRIRAVTEQYLTPLRDGQPFDLVHDFAIPLPVTIIAEMLGVPPERMRDFKRWSDAFIEGTTGAGRANPFGPEFTQAVLELLTYLRGVVRERRRRPGDDLVSVLVSEEPGGEALTDLDAMMFVQLLLVAGNETTTNLIGNAAYALLDHPEPLERVRRDPALVPALVEEAVRYESPVQMVFRTATRDAEIGGATIRAGANVAVLLGSANRDERRFPDPDRFDVDRDTRGHLGFGFGEHFCLGASLARLEARVALEALVPELARLERVGRRELVDSFLVRGPKRLELRRAA